MSGRALVPPVRLLQVLYVDRESSLVLIMLSLLSAFGSSLLW
jgi:hypothetical protein